MDETALIALGILLDEGVREVLGETGDLAFTEGVREDELGDIEGDIAQDGNSGSEDEIEEDIDEAGPSRRGDKGKGRAVEEDYDEKASAGSDSVYSAKGSDDDRSD